jgi:hypothetical protein
MKAKNVQGIICLVILFLFSNQAWAADWIPYDVSILSGSCWYYDKSSVKKVNNNIIRVWTKLIYGETEKTKAFLFLKGIGKAPDNSDKLSHVKILSEVDCVNDKIISISMIFYDAIGNPIYSSPKSFDEWADIVPDSNTEKLKNIVCSDSKTSETKKK